MTTDARAATAVADVKMVIGGEQVDAADGQTFEVVNPATGEVIARAPLGGPRTSIARWPPRRRPSTIRRAGPPGRPPSAAGRCRSTPASSSRTWRSWPSSRSANVGKPITSARSETFAVSLVLDYYAGAANKLFGETIPVSAPGLDFTLREPIGVVRADRPVELPDEHGHLEARPGAGRRQHHHPQAGQPHAADRPAPGRAGARGGLPARRRERRHRSRRIGRRGPGRAPGSRQDRLHRRDDHRPGDHATGRRQREEGQPRARRQEPQHRASPMPTWSASPPRRRWPSSTTPGRTARREAGSWSRRRSTIASVELLREATAKVKLGATLATSRPRSAAWSASKQRDRVLDYVESGRPREPSWSIGGEAPSGDPFDIGAYLQPTIFDGAAPTCASCARRSSARS